MAEYRWLITFMAGIVEVVQMQTLLVKKLFGTEAVCVEEELVGR